jgi:hypothetical protein
MLKWELVMRAKLYVNSTTITECITVTPIQTMELCISTKAI